jgi:DNA-binding PadR family transcriptional regulator
VFPGGPGGGPGGPGFPFGGPWGPFAGMGRQRMRRGDVRAAILVLLAEQPSNGYQIMQELAQRSQGAWKPSPGSVYPALALLEDEGLIRDETTAAGKLFSLTDAGRTYVADHRDELGTPWATATAAAGDPRFELMGMIRHIGAAAAQVAHSGNPAQIAEAQKVMRNARRALYRILAEDGGPDDADDAADDEADGGAGAPR